MNAETSPFTVNMVSNCTATQAFGGIQTTTKHEEVVFTGLQHWLSTTHVSVTNRLKCQCELLALQLESAL